MGVEASSFHVRANDSYLANPTDGYNYIRGMTYFGDDSVVVTGS